MGVVEIGENRFQYDWLVTMIIWCCNQTGNVCHVGFSWQRLKSLQPTLRNLLTLGGQDLEPYLLGV